MIDRRFFLGQLLQMAGAAALLSGCASSEKQPETPLPPLTVAKLTDLVTGVGLSSLVAVRPREIAQIPFLIPDIAKFALEKDLDQFQKQTGFDLREIPEALLARYDGPLGAADLQIVRTSGVDMSLVEKLFLKRIVKNARRQSDRADVVRLSGVIGSRTQIYGHIGDSVALFQEGGDVDKGPLRIASLYAENKLKRAPRALDEDPLKGLFTRFGSAPLIALARGPFTGEWKKAALGLLEGATAVGAAARPTARENLGLALALCSDFHNTGDEGSETMMRAWHDFTESEMGRILGLHQPIQPPIPSHTADTVALSVEVDPHRFFEGLHALVAEDLSALMKLKD